MLRRELLAPAVLKASPPARLLRLQGLSGAVAPCLHHGSLPGLWEISTVLCLLGKMAGEHDMGECRDVEALDRLGKALEIFLQPPVARHPREAAFADLALGQEDEAALGLRQLHDVQRVPWSSASSSASSPV